MNSRSELDLELTCLMPTLGMIVKSGIRLSSNCLNINKKILEARYIFIDDENIDIEKPPKTEDKYDLRDSDFNEDGTIISINEAIEKYREEAQANREEEERRLKEEQRLKEEEDKRLQEEEERKRKEMEELENQNKQANQGDYPDTYNNSSQNQNESIKEENNQNNRFMSEESFLNQLKLNPATKSQRKKDRANSKNKQALLSLKASPRDQNEDNNEGNATDVKLSKKNRSTKPVLNTEGDADLDNDHINSNRASSKSRKKRLKIKQKKEKQDDEQEDKVERLNPVRLPLPVNLNAQSKSKRFDIVIDEVDPDPEEEANEEEVQKTNYESKRLPQTLTLDPVRQSKFSHRETINGENVNKQQSNGGLGDCNFYGHQRKKTVEREKKPNLMANQNDSLLDKWEKEYGGIKNKQIFNKKEKEKDSWNVAKNKFSNYNYGYSNDDNDVKEEINDDPEDYKFVDTKARKNTKEGANKHNEFDLDWDEDESYSYLKKINNENTKENINKLRVQNKLLMKNSKQPTDAYNPVTSKPNEKKTEKLKKSFKTDRMGERHFKSVAPQLEDWDEE